MATIVIVTDLPSKVQAAVEASLLASMVAGANAKASRVAPCLDWDGTVTDQPAPTADQLAEAKLVLIGAIQRWAEAGSGALTQQSAGPFSQSMDTRQRSGFNLWPSEITDLQAICKAATGESGRLAFSIDTAPPCTIHADWCSALTYTDATGAVVYGGAYCTCGADIAGYPIYEPA